MKKIRIYDIGTFRAGSFVNLCTTTYEELYITIQKEGYVLFADHYKTDCISDKHIVSDAVLNATLNDGVCLIDEEDIDIMKVKMLINDLLRQYYNECEVEYEISNKQLQEAFYHIAD